MSYLRKKPRMFSGSTTREMASALVLTAGCGALAYYSFRRHRDAPFAVTVGILVFVAFLAGSLLRPVEFTSKRESLESAVAEGVSGTDRSSVTLDQQSLDDLPNIPVPAAGHIDVVGMRRGGDFSPSTSPRLTAGEEVELHGWAGDPVAKRAGSGLFAIVNSTRRIDVSPDYGSGHAAAVRPVESGPQGTIFVVDLPASALQQGSNQIELGIVAQDQRGFFKLPDRVTVTVTER
jgi:hypothetical protein